MIELDAHRIGLASDWAGDATAVAPALSAFADRRANHVFHVGDFGLDGDQYDEFVHHVSRMARRHGVRVYVVPGPNEQVVIAPVGDPERLADRVDLIPRGMRLQVGKRVLLAAGGPPNVDRSQVSGVGGLLEPVVTVHDGERMIAGGPVDILLLGEAPRGGTVAVDRTVAYGGGDDPRVVSETWAQVRPRETFERQVATEVWVGVMPSFTAHGGYGLTAHDRGERLWGGSGAVMSLNRPGQYGNLAVLALKDLSAEVVPLSPLPGSVVTRLRSVT